MPISILTLAVDELRPINIPQVRINHRFSIRLIDFLTILGRLQRRPFSFVESQAVN
ncbi:MAG: hypothetical protein ACM3PP_13425 [Candidatus Saccharibacteria bacterium]